MVLNLYITCTWQLLSKMHFTFQGACLCQYQNDQIFGNTLPIFLCAEIKSVFCAAHAVPSLLSLIPSEHSHTAQFIQN